MTREEKRQFVEQWSAEMKEVPFAVLVDYRGLTVAQATELRAKMRECDSSYLVVKNTLAKVALEQTPLKGLQEHFFGTTAIAYNRKDPVAMTKALLEFAKTAPKMQIKIGLVEGTLLKPEQIEELSRMPSKVELLSKLLYLLKYPIQGLATVLNAIPRNLAVVLNQVAQNKE
jgi:large subunit ribosomal protein L10